MANAASKIRLCSATREQALAWRMKAKYDTSTPTVLGEIAEALTSVADKLEGSTRQVSRTREALFEATYLADTMIIESANGELTTKRGAAWAEALKDMADLRAQYREILGTEEDVVTALVLRGTALDPLAREKDFRADSTPEDSRASA